MKAANSLRYISKSCVSLWDADSRFERVRQFTRRNLPPTQSHQLSPFRASLRVYTILPRPTSSQCIAICDPGQALPAEGARPCVSKREKNVFVPHNGPDYRFVGGEVPLCLLFARKCWNTIVLRPISSQGVAVYDLVMDMDTAKVRQGLLQGRKAHQGGSRVSRMATGGDGKPRR